MQSLTTQRPFDLLEKNDEFWKSPRGIQKRVEMIGEFFTYKIVNNATKIYGKTDGAKWVVWMTNPGASKTGPCYLCAGRHGRKWRITWFTPRMPAHIKCVCDWMVEYE